MYAPAQNKGELRVKFVKEQRTFCRQRILGQDTVGRPRPRLESRRVVVGSKSGGIR